MISKREKRERRRRRLIQWGVYFAIVLGVVAQGLVERLDIAALTVEFDLAGWTWVRLALALCIGGAVYYVLDGRKGELHKKTSNLYRILAFGFMSGYTAVDVLGVFG